MAEPSSRPKPVVRRIAPTHSPRRGAVVDDATRQRRRRVVIAIGVTFCVALMVVAPYVTGVLAEQRVRALVDRLARAGGDHVAVRLARYHRGYASADAVLEITSDDIVSGRSRFEIPFRVGHGPIPFVDIFSGRSALRVCAGFLSVDLGRGRSPTGATLVPVRGRTVLGYFGGIEGELGLRANDIRPLSPNGRSEPARVSLVGDDRAMRIEGFLAEWRDQGVDGAVLHVGGLGVRIGVDAGRVTRHLELARLSSRAPDHDVALEQLVVDLDDVGVDARDVTFSLRASSFSAGYSGRRDVLREPALTYTSKRRGDVAETRLSVAIASYSAPDGGLGRSSLRVSARVPRALAARVAAASAQALAPTPAVTNGRAAPIRNEDRLLHGQTQLMRLAMGDDAPELAAMSRAVLAYLRAAPSLTIEGEVRAAEGPPLFDGRIVVRADSARAQARARILGMVIDTLVLDIDADFARDPIVALAEFEVARRASHLATGEDPARRASLAVDVVEGAVRSGALVEHEGVFRLRASIPLGQPTEATFAGRSLAAYADSLFGLALRRAEMPRVRISLGAVISSGQLSDADVVIRIAPRARDLRLCAEAELLDAPPVLEGDVQIAIDVGADGAVHGTRVLANTLRDDSLAACLTGALVNIPFAPTRRGGSSVIPIHVSRGGAPTIDEPR